MWFAFSHVSQLWRRPFFTETIGFLINLLQLTDTSVSERKKIVIWSKQTNIKDVTHTPYINLLSEILKTNFEVNFVHLSFVNERVYLCCSLSLVRPVLRAAPPRLRPPVVWKNGMPDPHDSAAPPPLQRFLILRTRTHPPNPPPRPERPEHYPNPHHPVHQVCYQCP